MSRHPAPDTLGTPRPGLRLVLDLQPFSPVKEAEGLRGGRKDKKTTKSETDATTGGFTVENGCLTRKDGRPGLGVSPLTPESRYTTGTTPTRPVQELLPRH